MKPEAINSAIAKHLGINKWLIIKRGLFWCPNSAGYTDSIELAGRYSEAEAKLREYKPPGHQGEWVTIKPAPHPNYHGDLNAMHEAEGAIVPPEEWTDEDLTQWGKYHRILNRIALNTCADGVGRDQRLIRATAAQRAEAFLRAVGKWEGGAA